MYLFIALLVAFVAFKIIAKIDYNNMESAVLQELGFKDWNIVPYFDYSVTVKSRQALEKYDDIRFFKENREKLSEANDILKKKADIATLNYLTERLTASKKSKRLIAKNGLLLATLCYTLKSK